MNDFIEYEQKQLNREFKRQWNQFSGNRLDKSTGSHDQFIKKIQITYGVRKFKAEIIAIARLKPKEKSRRPYMGSK